jgi:hypothetical protein
LPPIYATHHDSVKCLLKKKEKLEEHKHLINCVYKCGGDKQVIQNSKKIGCPSRISIDPNINKLTISNN